MISDTLSNSLSGLKAAENRLSASASNVANAQSTSQQTANGVVNSPYQAITVTDQSLQTGGVRSIANSSGRQNLLVNDPDSPLSNENGLVEFPNTDLVSDQVNTIVASAQFKANLAVFEAGDELLGTLLDIDE